MSRCSWACTFDGCPTKAAAGDNRRIYAAEFNVQAVDRAAECLWLTCSPNRLPASLAWSAGLRASVLRCAPPAGCREPTKHRVSHLLARQDARKPGLVCGAESLRVSLQLCARLLQLLLGSAQLCSALEDAAAAAAVTRPAVEHC